MATSVLGTTWPAGACGRRRDACPHHLVRAERAPAHPADASVRQHRQPNHDPQRPAGSDSCAQHGQQVRRSLGRRNTRLATTTELALGAACAAVGRRTTSTARRSARRRASSGRPILSAGAGAAGGPQARLRSSSLLAMADAEARPEKADERRGGNRRRQANAMSHINRCSGLLPRFHPWPGTMNWVEATIRLIFAREAGGSNAFTAGVIPNSSRIQAACRASTEWMPTAAARTASDRSFGACPLYAATARSSSATAVFRNAAAVRSRPESRTCGRLTALSRAVGGTRSRAPVRSHRQLSPPRAVSPLRAPLRSASV